MINLKNILLLVFVVILIAGCSVSIVNKEKLFIKKGISTAEFKKIYEEHTKKTILEIKGEDVYDISLNQDNSNKYTVILKQKEKTWFFLFRLFEPRKFEYMYAFKNDSLLFWGNTVEFARHQSPIINEIAKRTIEKFDDYLAD